MKIATLALIGRGKKVLLGLKRGGSEIGDGIWNGPGGKLEPGETLRQCLLREAWEEVRIRIDPRAVRKVAVITFCVAGVPDFEVHVYRVTRWTGTARATRSMLPRWFGKNDLPLQKMHESDRAWFPKALRGKKFRAFVYYRKRAKDFDRIKFLPYSP